MRVIIAGSRGITDLRTVKLAVAKSKFRVTEVVSGTARGVDRLGEEWADLHGVPVTKWPADWLKYGRAGGFIRNSDMAHYADALVAVWDGESRGTKHMISAAKERGLKVYVHKV